jgi:hypothetical protein
VRAKSKNVLSVAQTASVLGIGRGTAYTQCRLNLLTDHREGIPCHRISNRILVYRAELEAWLGFPIEVPPADDTPPAVSLPPPAAPPAPPPPATADRPKSSRRPRRVPPEQGTLPF